MARLNKVAKSFNSLQTGKWIHSCLQPTHQKADGVSIPFKRESGFTVDAAFQDIDDIVEFQFPSNGKVDSQLLCVQYSPEEFDFSFQFPSNGKVDSQQTTADAEKFLALRFNSLQTGKWIHSCLQPTHQKADGVSIPFKRERGDKVSRPLGSSNESQVSIPFKRERGDKVNNLLRCFYVTSFIRIGLLEKITTLFFGFIKERCWCNPKYSKGFLYYFIPNLIKNILQGKNIHSH